jgi:GH25 family lysozyme M1 (1,4-beta-N-acetylmuramidase)
MNEGTLELDPVFEKNMEGAAAAGIKTGVYFFSQAITKQEAEEEADFVLRAIEKYKVTYPVIFDTERVTTYNARANGLSYEDRTDMCITFCDRVAAAGYTPMIYANTKYMIMGVNLERLEKYDKWFAVYSDKITFPYDFQMLQYSESGSIPGIKGNVDLDISFVDYSKADDSNE